jgi:hypothetical protein
MSFETPTLWRSAYICVNLIALLAMLLNNELMGDAQGLPVLSPLRLIISCILVIVSYWIFMGPLFRFIRRLHVVRIKSGVLSELVKNRFGVFLIVAQAGFMAFNVAFGVNIAGSGTARVDSALGLIWIFLPVDTLFLIYYAVARDNKYFRANLAVYILSNVIRGWLGIFLFIIFLEMCRNFPLKKIKWKFAIPFVCVVLAVYPILLNLKWLFRAAASSDVSIVDGIGGVAQSLSAEDYLQIISAGFMQIVGRLQLTSSVEEVIRYSSQLQHAYELGLFKPFWLEGIHGIAFDRLAYGENRPALGVAFTAIGEFSGDFDVGSWNTNTGWVGWFFVVPALGPIFVIYSCALAYLSLFMAKNIGMNKLLENLVWLSWLLYLMPGWLGAFVAFIYALFVFLVLKILFSLVPRISLLPATCQLSK